jgi:hypothetical protein
MVRGELNFKYDLKEQLTVARLKVKVLEKLVMAVMRIEDEDFPVSMVTQVKYFTSVERDVQIWPVGPRFAIDGQGKILSKWLHSDRNWPEVAYELTLISTLGVDELKELHDHLDEVCSLTR